MLKSFLAISLVVLTVFACNSDKEEGADAIARVNKQYLYPADLGLDNTGLDSSAWDQDQVDAWIERQVWFQEAEKATVETNIDKLVLDYKQSLLIEAYKEDLLQKANIQLSDEMILEYYKANLASNLLEEEQYKIAYYLLSPEMDDVELLKQLNDEKESESLLKHCEENPGACLKEALWVDKGVLESIELPKYLWKTSVKFQRFYKEDGSLGIYRIESKKKIGEPIPLELLSDQIRSILVFQKEKEFIEKHGEKLMLNAQNENSFEIY